MVSNKILKYFYPNDYRNGTKQFYDWIKNDLSTNSIILNLGAGPTKHLYVQSLRPLVKKLIGADPDEAVLNNPDLDEAYIIKNKILPFEDNSFDLVFCDYVLEHVNDPFTFFSEIKRVLKNGGAFYYRTPNKYHYVSIISRFTPHWFHNLFANKVRCMYSEETHEPYKTYYNVNSKRILNIISKELFFSSEMIIIESEPSYLKFNTILFLIGVFYERILNSTDLFSDLRANILGRMIK